MKRILILGLVMLFLAVGATVMAGRTFQAQLVQLEAEVSKDPRLEVVNTSLNKGLFSSSGSLTVAMYLENKQRLVIESPWQATHFPGWVDYTGQLLLSLDLESQEAINLLEVVGVQAPQYQGTAGWKKATFQMHLEPFVFNNGSTSLEVSAVNLTGSYSYVGEQIGQLAINKLVFTEHNDAATTFDLSDLTLSWNQISDYPWVQGTADLKVARIYVSNQQQNIELTQPSWSQELVLNQQTFDYLASLDLGEIKSQGSPMGSAKLTLKTENFNGQALADLMDVVATNTRLEDAEAEDLARIQNALNSLLGGSPAIVLQEFNIDLKMPFILEQKTTGKLSFDGRNLPLNYLQQVESGRLDSNDLINRTRLELNFSQLDPGILMMLGISTAVLNPDQAEQKLVFEAGELRLNGNHLPF
ncbi:MAG: YdgA family protein [Pseudomonadaceae bacterium]|nr:YdgA family protein [Pseudomonadaceae bacterium]